MNEKNDLLTEEIQKKIKFFSMGKELILFSGSFDPFHKGHLRLAKYVFALFRAKIVFTAFEKVIEKPNLSDLAIRNEVIDQSIKKYPYFQRWNQSDRVNCDNAMFHWPDYRIFKLFGIDSFQSFMRNPEAGNQLELCNVIIHLRPSWEFIRLEDWIGGCDWENCPQLK